MKQLILSDEEADELEQLLLDTVYGNHVLYAGRFDRLFNILHNLENTPIFNDTKEIVENGLSRNISHRR